MTRRGRSLLFRVVGVPSTNTKLRVEEPVEGVLRKRLVCQTRTTGRDSRDRRRLVSRIEEQNSDDGQKGGGWGDGYNHGVRCPTQSRGTECLN